MEKKYFQDLLNKHLSGCASKEEQAFLDAYYNLFESEEDVMALMPKETKEELKEEIFAAVLQSAADAAPGQRTMGKIKFLSNHIARIAAAAIFTGICFTAFFYWSNQNSRVSPIKTAAGQIKENKKIYLPDGSTVLVKDGSKLYYDSAFNTAKTRDVYLEGEASFDIKHNAQRSFIVHSGQVKTTVLGTAFTVKAFPNEENITVTVMRGKVKVSDRHKMLGIITLNQQIIYHKPDGHFLQVQVPAKTNMDLENDQILFDNVTVTEVAALLEQRFNVRIVFAGEEIQSKRFTTTLSKHQTLDEALKVICEFNEAVYEYNSKDSSVIIIENKLPNN